MKRLLLKGLLLLAVSSPAYAFEIWEGESAQLDCTAPTHYTNGDPIEAPDVITYNLYQDGSDEILHTGAPACAFTVSPPAGTYLYRATAVSLLYGNESLPSNDAEVVVNVKKRLMSPANLTATKVSE